MFLTLYIIIVLLGDSTLLGELLSSLDWLVAMAEHVDVFLFLRNLRMYRSGMTKQVHVVSHTLEGVSLKAC